jgi:hypothetical protein
MAVDLSVYQRPVFSDYLRRNAEEEFNRRMEERKLQAVAARANSPGQLPAAIQITNELEMAAKAAQDPNLAPAARQAAKNRYNILTQTAKTFGIDRGMEPALPDYGMGGLPQVYGQGSALPPELPPMDPGMSADPQNEFARALEQIDKQGGLSPVTGPRPIPGYAGAAGQIAATKKGMETQAQKNVELRMNPQIANQTAEQTALGKQRGETGAVLNEVQARMPQLQDTVSRLSALGKLATYTMAGQARDTLTRQLGIPVGDAAQARTEYISMVDNEVLPLLRQTFGAQFTEREGQSLKITLGDPNKDPNEKDRVLKSFIRTKMETVNSMSREVGRQEPYSQEDIQGVLSAFGGQSRQPAAPQQTMPRPPEIEFNLKRQGFTQEQINEYMKARGLR